MEKSESLHIKLLADTPASEDLFENTHDRIAEAIADLITHDEGGKTIGLEGGWGSGKSTIINLLGKKLADDTILLILFDSWAHENDPLRRTFLETIIGSIRDKQWADADFLDTKMLMLSHRIRKVDIESEPRVGLWGGLIAICFLLVPIGIILLNIATKTDTALSGWADFQNIIVTNWILVIPGSILVLSPFIVTFVGAMWAGLWKNLYNTGVSIVNFFRKKFSGAKQPYSKLESDFSWSALISQKHSEETRTETIEQPNPTSIEFSDIFVALMREVIGNDKERKIVLTIDNLDRISNEDGLAILSSLQTFLQNSDYQKEEWFNQLWVIIPHDRDALEGLWDDKKTGGTDVAKSFLDKMLQVRFAVPPLLLSDWKAYMLDELEKAFPQAFDSNVKHSIYRVYALSRPKNSVPNPRDIKLYINQIGTVYRQWGNTYPLEHVAYYVYRRFIDNESPQNLRNMLLSRVDEMIANPKLRALLGRNIRENIAGMLFNTEVKRAEQILLNEPLISALSSGDSQQIEKLRDYTGFWEMLENVEFSELSETEEEPAITNAALAITNSNLREHNLTATHTAIRNLYRAAENLENWDFLDEDEAEGIKALLELAQPNVNIGHFVTKLAVIPQKDASKIREWTEGIIYLANGVWKDWLDSESKAIPFLGDAETYIEFCAVLRQIKNTENLWDIFNISHGTFKADEISAAYMDALKSDFPEKYYHALAVILAQNVPLNWQPFVTQANNQLKDVNAGHSPDYRERLLASLWELCEVKTNIDDLLRVLAEQGFLLHHLHHVRSNIDAAAWFIYVFLCYKPDIGMTNNIGNANAGHAYLKDQILSAKDGHQAITDIIIQQAHDDERLGQLLFEVLEKAKLARNWVIYCITRAIELDYSEQLMDAATLITQWQFLNSNIEQAELNTLLHAINQNDSVSSYIVESTAFDASLAILYTSTLAEFNTAPDTYVEWCVEGLQSVDKKLWLQHLSREGTLLKLALMLKEREVDVALPHAFADAIREHAKQTARGASNTSPIVSEAFEQLLTLLDASATPRSVLTKDILEIAINAEGNIHATFFQIYGSEIIQEIISGNSGQRIVRNLFEPLLKSETGIEWLNALFHSHPDLLQKYPDDEVKSFIARIQGEIKNSEFKDDLLTLAETLGLIIETETEQVPKD